MIERLAVDHPDVFDVYARFARQNHGALIRSAFNWEEYWRFENEEERTAAVYYGANQEPLGVLFYWVADEVFHIKEMFYLNQKPEMACGILLLRIFRWFIGSRAISIKRTISLSFRRQPN